jgi:opacity protein-like surface antigen
MKSQYLLAAGLTLFLPSLVVAQSASREAGWDFGGSVIYQLSQDVDFEGGSVLSLEDDIGAAIEFGYRFNPRFELQFMLDWNSAEYHGTLQSAQFPNVTADISGDMESFTPRLNGVFNFMEGPLTPYVIGGVGWSFIDTNIPTGQVSVGCWWDPWWGQICTPYQPTLDVDGFTYELGLGVRWDIGDHYSLKLAYEKSWFELDHASSTPDLDLVKAGFYVRY